MDLINATNYISYILVNDNFEISVFMLMTNCERPKIIVLIDNAINYEFNYGQLYTYIGLPNTILQHLEYF